MSLTHLDCNIFRGAGASNDSSSYVVLNPRGAPGSLVISVSMAAKESLSGQVACKLGLEHFINGVLDYYETSSEDEVQVTPIDSPIPLRKISLEVLESAFKKANSSVYQFAHKLAAGGRMASTLMGVVLEDKVIAAGKVGPGNVFLYRDKDLFAFFDDTQKMPNEIAHETYIGAHSAVSVELATLPAEQGDKILIFPFAISPGERAELSKILRSADFDELNLAAHIAKHIFQDVYKLPFVACATIGPETIYLAQAV